MIAWLIPYLVAYNAANSEHWKHGPEHVFKAEARTFATLDDSSRVHSNIDMFFACRPMNSSLMQCRIESAIIENWRVEPDGSKDPSDTHPPEEFAIGNVVFQVEFNEQGISKLWFLNTNGSYRLNMIRAILSTVNWGIDLSEKKYDRHTLVEKSIIGICETTFDISRNISSEEKNLETNIDGYSFTVPAFKGKSSDGPIVIKKNRNIKKCSKNTPYFFGSDEDEVSDEKLGLETKIVVTSSQSWIHLGEKSFSAHTRSTGTVQFTSTRAKTMKSFMKTDDSIRFSLVSIRPAKEELRNTGNLANTGAGSVPGTPWPERKDSRVKFYM